MIIEHVERKLNASRTLLLSGVGFIAITGSVLFGLVNAPLKAQSTASQAPTADWMKAVGGKMAFEVASVKQNVSDTPPHTNVTLGNLDEGPPEGGLLSSVKFGLVAYISFAYKLTPSQGQLLRPQLPKWATTDRFDIQARADDHATRDQMRLMMQSLLADRFKLAVHNEIRQIPVFGLVLEKPGKMGPQLIPLPTDEPCTAQTPPVPNAVPKPSAKDDGWFTPCGGLGALLVSGRWHVGARNLTMEQVASMLPPASMGALDRPLLDQTGLIGKFDFKIEFMPEHNGPAPPNAQPDLTSPQPDATGPTFLEALKEQLGLKL